MKALSFLQPWAFCVLFLGKRTENRKRPTQHRGQVVMHISKGWSKEGEQFVRDNWVKIKRKGDMADSYAFLSYAGRERGGYAGTFTIEDCHPYGLFCYTNPWAFGPFCYSLANVKPFGKNPQIIPARGQLGFWNVPEPEGQKEIEKLWKKIKEAKK